MRPTISELKLHIGGMDCAECARTLERSVAQVQGVEMVQVNFAAATLEASGQVDLEQIVERVHALGYRVIAEKEVTDFHQPAGHRQGLVMGFVRYLLARPQTAWALGGAIILLFSLPVRFLLAAPLGEWVAQGLHIAVLGLAGVPIARKGFRSLFIAHQITIDLLMSIAALGALLIGETGEAATVILLFAIGEALEGYTADRARDSLRSLLALRPDEATVLRPCLDCVEHLGQNGYSGGPCPFCGTHEVRLSVEEVIPGDIVLVRPGERIPVDGCIVNGVSAIDQSSITGESIPVPKSVGDEVLAGTINGEAALEIKTVRRAADSAISRIVRLVEQTQSQRAPIERFVDRFARWYTPAVVILAILVAIVPPILFGAPFLDVGASRGWLYRALALLIVACPCALVISTPVTVVSSLTSLARRGVLIKGGAYLDALARVKTFAFDKTGTLTEGQPVVVQAQALNCLPGQARCDACDDLVAIAAAVERRSEHLLARAIVAEAEARDLMHRYAPAEAVQSLAGQGVRGTLGDMTVTVGSHAFFHERFGECSALHSQVVAAEDSGQTVMMVGRDGVVLGFMGVADRPRPTSGPALKALKAIDPAMRTVMLTGDNPAVARAIAHSIGGIDEVRARLLPEDKAEAVRKLQDEYGPLAMVGDGVNDAPALAAATVGIAMGGAGTAQAMETADVVLMQDDLTRLPDAVLTSRRARRIIWQNIAFSLAIKGAFLLLTLPGWATMWMAVFADMGASLLVTLNGIRMLRSPA